MGFIEMILRTDQTPITILLMSFCIGIIIGPTSFGLLYYVMFLLLYEIVVLFLTQGGKKYRHGDTLFRVFYISAGLMGWIVGRTINSNVLENKPFFQPIRN